MKPMALAVGLLLLLLSCKKQKGNAPDIDIHLLHQSWNVYESTMDGATTPGLSYFFLSRYATGVEIRSNNTFYYRYYPDSNNAIYTAGDPYSWSMDNNNRITFSTPRPSNGNMVYENINCEIEKMDTEFLWLKYEHMGHTYQYKLRKN